MRKIRDVLRMAAAGMSQRQIAACLRVSRDTVSDYERRAKAAGLAWPLPGEIDDPTLEALLFPQAADNRSMSRKPEPDYGYLHDQLKMRSDATIEVLHLEFLERHPNGISYSLMCERYREYVKGLKLYLRKVYKAGEVAFVDYSGSTVGVYDPAEKKWRTAQIFVGVLAASNYTYAEATFSQKIPDWIESHNNMFAFFGGVPHTITPDNLKSAVVRPGRSEPVLQETYEDMASHYGTVILPARVRKPKDKGKVEFAVRFAQRWILFRLRKRTFTSLGELNEAMRELLKGLNEKPFQKLEGCRRSSFETIDKPALLPLPHERYEYVKFMKVRAGSDYHVTVEDHDYSVPHQFANQVLDIRLGARAMEAYHNGKRIASHAVSTEAGGQTTLEEHMPPGHRHYSRWNPENDLKIAATIGPSTARFMELAFKECRNLNAGYRQGIALQGLIRESESHWVEKAAEAALRSGRRHLVSVLREFIGRRKLGNGGEENDGGEASFDHGFIRGEDYYH